MRAAVAQGLELFAIMEDDLMPVGNISEEPPLPSNPHRDGEGIVRTGFISVQADCCRASGFKFKLLRVKI